MGVRSPAAAHEACRPTAPFSRRTTRRPSFASAWSLAIRMMPPPRITASALRFMIVNVAAGPAAVQGRARPLRSGPMRIAPRLLRWFRAEARDLPWRRTRDPYAIWISEVMLQQTQIATVLPYFARWMKRFPDVDALARASIDDVLKAWEGLGYYARARNVHKAAALLVRDGFPDTRDGWGALPGAGPYTAAAIASIVHGERTPVCDGNVRRVVARLLKIQEVITSSGAARRVEEFLATQIPVGAPGD